MALHAVFILVYPLFHVLLTDLRARVLVTTVAAVSGIVVVDMAGHAVGVVVSVKAEVFFMLEGGRKPGLPGMALATAALDLKVQGITRSAVATVALLLQIRLHQLVRELTDGTERLYALVIAVTGDSINF